MRPAPRECKGSRLVLGYTADSGLCPFIDCSTVTDHSPKTIILPVAGALLFVALCLGCASTPSVPPPPSTLKLVSAGFKVVDAKTQLQQQRIEVLPQGRVSEWQVTGKTYYVYPDPATKQLYVGTQKAYDTYRLLNPAAASDSLARQNALNMADYNSQDARMQINTNNDLTDPWSLWDNVEGLGGR